MYPQEAAWGQGARLSFAPKPGKKKLSRVSLLFLAHDRPLLSFGTMMGKESEWKSKIEIVINMLMLGSGAGKSGFIPFLVCLSPRARRGKSEIHTEQNRKRTRGNVHDIAWGSSGAHTDEHTKQESTACATFLFQSASGDGAKDLLLAHWWDKKQRRRAALETRRASFPPHRMEAPLSIGSHLPCCVIMVHNGAHLIQAAQGFFPQKPFSSIHSQTSHVLERYYAAFWAQGHHIFAFEWNVVCNQDKILPSAYYKKAVSTNLIFDSRLLFLLLSGGKQSCWPFPPGLLCVCVAECRVNIRALRQAAARTLPWRRSGCWGMHSALFSTNEYQSWSAEMKNDWFENYCWAFSLNRCRVGIDGYLHNLAGILIIVSGICMQMT